MGEWSDGWRMRLASDVHRDGMGLELMNPSGDVVAEIFRSDVAKTVTVATFANDIPLTVFDRYDREAWVALDPFEDGTSFTAAGIAQEP
jgi:hypothetical protein